MREIINDKRYGALRTLGERKQAFNEVILLSYTLKLAREFIRRELKKFQMFRYSTYTFFSRFEQWCL